MRDWAAIRYSIFNAVCSAAVLAFSCSDSEAAEWQTDGTLNQSLSYDDNYRMAQDPIGSMIYQLIPTIKFARKTESWDVDAHLSYGLQTYTDSGAIDQNPQRYALDTAYRTERSSLGFNTGYNITPARNQAAVYSGNFFSNADRKNWWVSPSYSYRLTERDTLFSSGTYSETSFSTSDFSGSRNHSVNLGWQRQWTEHLDLSLSAFYSSFESATNLLNFVSDSYGINLAGGYILSEQWQINGAIGVRMTDTTIEGEFAPGLISSEQSTTEGFLSDLVLQYKGEKLSSSLGLGRALIPSGLGQLTEQTRLNLGLSYKLSERLTSDLKASYLQTDSVSNERFNSGLNRNNLMLTTALNWEMTQEWVLSITYRYRKQEFTTPDKITADSNTFMMTVNYKWPGLNISR